MKKLIIVLLVLFTTNIVAQNNTRKVPEVVLNKFTKKYPNAELKKWKREKDFYLAKFIISNRKYFAFYSSDGTWQRTETNIKWKNLPVEVMNGVRKSEYNSWKISEIKQVEMSDQMVYLLLVDNGNLLDADRYPVFKEDFILYFTSEGNILKKVKKC
ncbi:MAG TPA: PepSY-like domain-containing protein [Bacteroidia bacterium]|nr:PepSY-like domain-containing protein [Bacteroidia bacterium]